MKKTATKKTTTKMSKAVEPKTTTCEANIVDINTDKEMVSELAIAKLNAGRGIDVSEFANLCDIENEKYDQFAKNLIDGYEQDELKNRCMICKLQHDLAWATRPWYKKLMFWKKKPECNCIKAYS